MKDGNARWRNRVPSFLKPTELHPTRLSLWSRVNAAGATAAAKGHGAADDLLKGRIGTAAFAFRGYDVSNLGRSPELLEHPAYGPVVQQVLDEASAICSEVLKTHVDLAERVRNREETSLTSFPLDTALIVAMELAQLALLERFFEVPIRSARLSFGYSIGELTALIYGGVFTLEQLLPIPLELAPDCAELAADTTLGVLFTRKAVLHREDVEQLCMLISSEGRGMIGPSAYLSPNTALLLGQGNTLDRFEAVMRDHLPKTVHLRRNPNRWPPLHTPLVWSRNIPNRAANAVYHIEGGMGVPSPPLYSCVTGRASYDGPHNRDLIIQWTDHPQLLWDVIRDTLAAGVELVVHVGPEPKLIPATFARLSNNVSKHLGNKYLHRLGQGVATSMGRHAWLTRFLPSETALLRAPFLKHVVLEDWLLEQAVP